MRLREGRVLSAVWRVAPCRKSTGTPSGYALRFLVDPQAAARVDASHAEPSGLAVASRESTTSRFLLPVAREPLPELIERRGKLRGLRLVLRAMPSGRRAASAPQTVRDLLLVGARPSAVTHRFSRGCGHRASRNRARCARARVDRAEVRQEQRHRLPRLDGVEAAAARLRYRCPAAASARSGNRR